MMDKKRKISIRSAKSKGRRLQQWCCEKISSITNLPWGKDEMIASREMGQGGVDVRLIGEAKELFPFSIEAKNCERWAIHEWIKQAKENQMENTKWLLIAKRNQTAPVAIMDAKVFFEMWNIVLRYKTKYKLKDIRDSVAKGYEKWQVSSFT